MNPETALTNSTASGREPLKEALGGAAVLLFMLVLLFFRNWRMFVCPEPWAEDMAVFLRAEYVTGFPDTAFALYAGYIHLLPRIIAWLSLKAGFENAMLVMNWSVLLIKAVTCFLILRTSLICSRLMRAAITAYLILMPFADEIYNNVTNLQWWLIPLMALIILRRGQSVPLLILEALILLLAGLTGVNSVIFAVPCAYLMIKDRTPESIIKCSAVILCALVQFYFLYTSGRSGTGRIIYEGGIADLISLISTRIILHTLFKVSAGTVPAILLLVSFTALLAFMLQRFRTVREVRFIALFAGVYTAVIMYNILKTEKDMDILLTGFAGERYFVFLRICVFALLVSALDLLFKSPHLRGNYKRLLTVTCLILAVVFVRRYPVKFPFGFEYYADLDRLEAAKPGENITIRFPPPDWNCVLRKK